jgi:hypothetical protein
MERKRKDKTRYNKDDRKDEKIKEKKKDKKDKD